MNLARLISRTLPLLAVALVLFAATTALACPNCKDALASADGEQANLVTGFFWSVLFMMSMPFVLLGTFGFCMHRAVKKARAQQEAEQAAAQAEQDLVEV